MSRDERHSSQGPGVSGPKEGRCGREWEGLSDTSPTHVAKDDVELLTLQFLPP